MARVIEKISEFDSYLWPIDPNILVALAKGAGPLPRLIEHPGVQ